MCSFMMLFCWCVSSIYYYYYYYSSRSRYYSSQSVLIWSLPIWILIHFVLFTFAISIACSRKAFNLFPLSVACNVNKLFVPLCSDYSALPCVFAAAAAITTTTTTIITNNNNYNNNNNNNTHQPLIYSHRYSGQNTNLCLIEFCALWIIWTGTNNEYRVIRPGLLSDITMLIFNFSILPVSNNLTYPCCWNTMG